MNRTHESLLTSLMLELGIPPDVFSEPTLREVLLPELARIQNSVVKDVMPAHDEYVVTLESGVTEYKIPRDTFTVDAVTYSNQPLERIPDTEITTIP